jgi:hypothetical protein
MPFSSPISNVPATRQLNTHVTRIGLMENEIVLTISTKINEQEFCALLERDKSSFSVMKVIESHETTRPELDFHPRVWYSILSPIVGRAEDPDHGAAM